MEAWNGAEKTGCFFRIIQCVAFHVPSLLPCCTGGVQMHCNETIARSVGLVGPTLERFL